ncbi:MAG: hypothetical protein GY936_08145 [Ignavibacteriae bacterium]|nr:hypothetical protein [Ignavibacteriota bacterium]
MKKKIYIVTGPIHSGKTTRLFKFVVNQNSIDGILAPIVNEERKLYHISSRKIKNLEVSESSDETISIGKYHFLQESFDWANANLIKSFNQVPDWIIIDELGKLELKREGLHKSASYILDKINDSSTKIILVIRDYLLEDIIEFYGISKEEYEILDLSNT